jgi:Kef-type K+ transport system membrane component KefB
VSGELLIAPEVDQPPPPPRSRVAIYYVALIALTAAVVAVVLVAGHGKHGQASLAGGYDVSAGSACLGAKADLTQSGQYVSISNTAGSLSGDLTLKHGRLTGTVQCVNHTSAAIDAADASGILHGTIGGQPLSAELKRDAPAAGSPTPRVPSSLASSYALAPSSACLGAKFTLAGSGTKYTLESANKERGTLSYRNGTLRGTIDCNHGGTRMLTGSAINRQIDLTLSAPAGAAAPASEHLQATKQRTSDQTVVAFFIAMLVVMLFARLCGAAMPKIRQPQVMGEVLAGIILGPTVFGAVAPGLQGQLFASDIVPYIGVASNLGLIFYMFLIGLEVDFAQLRGRIGMTLAISNTSLLFPLMLGMAAALPLYTVLGPSTRFLAFALFIAVSMSVTAFPVLARIISERRMIRRPLGALSLSAAALNDVSAWFLIALATAVAGAGSGIDVLRTIGEAAAYGLVMWMLIRRLLGRAAVAYDEAGRVPATWITIIFAGVLLSAVVTDKIGVAVILGGFMMGVVMPRHAGLTHEVTQRVEDFVLTLLLPLFFAYTGLRTNVGLLGRSSLILITLGLIAVAILGKFGGTLIAARTMNLPWRNSAALGALMNTRGLTELIVLNIALDAGVITPALFTGLVVMALVTTLMTGPLMRLIDPRNRFGAPPEEELAAATRLTVEEGPLPTHSILVAPQTDAALEPLLALALPLAGWEPPRELILLRLVRPPRGSAVRGGLQTEEFEVRAASEMIERTRLDLLDRGIASRAVAISSADPGRDLVRLSRSDEIDLVLLDGRRPLLGDGVPREDVGTVLAEAPCDVAVLVAREGAQVAPGPGAVVMVPFGGAEHDWAALELASWLCAASGASLELLGPGGQTPEGKDASHMLANAALLVQQFAGVAAKATVAAPGRAGIVEAAGRASLLVVGLSERWAKEGLGETRRAIARSAPAPIVFVRRGERPGALAPATDATRFAWSTPGITPVPHDFGRSFSRSFSRIRLPDVAPPAGDGDPPGDGEPPAE